MRRSAPPPTLARCCASFGIETRRRRTSVSTGSTFTKPPRPSVTPFRSRSPIPSTQIGEERWLLVGQSGAGRLVVVAHTERGDEIRIINARPATRRERQTYEEDQ